MTILMWTAFIINPVFRLLETSDKKTVKQRAILKLCQDLRKFFQFISALFCDSYFIKQNYTKISTDGDLFC